MFIYAMIVIPRAVTSRSPVEMTFHRDNILLFNLYSRPLQNRSFDQSLYVREFEILTYT